MKVKFGVHIKEQGCTTKEEKRARRHREQVKQVRKYFEAR
jgi:hypothetical protein